MWQVVSVKGKAPADDQSPEAKAKSEELSDCRGRKSNRISIPRRTVHKIQRLASNLTVQKFQLLQCVTAHDNEDGYPCCRDTQKLKSMEEIYSQNFV